LQRRLEKQIGEYGDDKAYGDRCSPTLFFDDREKEDKKKECENDKTDLFDEHRIAKERCQHKNDLQHIRYSDDRLCRDLLRLHFKPPHDDGEGENRRYDRCPEEEEAGTGLTQHTQAQIIRQIAAERRDGEPESAADDIASAHKKIGFYLQITQIFQISRGHELCDRSPVRSSPAPLASVLCPITGCE